MDSTVEVKVDGRWFTVMISDGVLSAVSPDQTAALIQPAPSVFDIRAITRAARLLSRRLAAVGEQAGGVCTRIVRGQFVQVLRVEFDITPCAGDTWEVEAGDFRRVESTVTFICGAFREDTIYLGPLEE